MIQMAMRQGGLKALSNMEHPASLCVFCCGMEGPNGQCDFGNEKSDKGFCEQKGRLRCEFCCLRRRDHRFAGDKYEKEAVRVIELGYVHPAYDYVLKCSHTFNLLDSRGAISVSERTAFISRVRNLARLCAQCYLKQREELGYPLLKKGAK